MKHFMLSLVVLGLPYWFPEAAPTALAWSEVEDKPCSAVGSTVQLELVGTPGGTGSSFAWVSATGEPEGSPRAWMGVSIDVVPEALAAQLEVPESGVLILNVMNDGPADRAGIQVHDVVLSVDGQSVSDGDAPRLAELIGSRKPGDKVNVVLVRQGQKKTVQIELGSRPEQMAWKIEADPKTKIEERIRTRGKIMGKGPGGEWFMKDLGDLHNLKDLGEHIKVLVPPGDSRSTQVFVDGNRKMVKVHVDDDGSSLNINQDDDGEITVRRTDQNGKETTATYETEDELKAGDPEAYELFAGKGKGAFVHLGGDGVGAFNVQIDGEWQVKLEEGLREAQEALANAREEMEEAHREMAEQLHGVGVTAPDGRSEPGAFSMFIGKPKQTFKVLPDGTIEVHIRKGDSEVVRTFSNEGDLSKRDPKLYEKYRSVMADGE